MENLQLNLDSLQLIAARNEKSSTELRAFFAKQTWSQQDREAILCALAQLLLDKECTLLISRHLRPLLVDLLERNAVAIKGAGQINYDLHERLCVAMGRLIGSHPDVLPFSLRYFKRTLPVFQRLFLESSDASTVRYGRRRMKLRDLMEAAYRFLQHSRPFFSEIWDWSLCVPLLRSHDTLVRWYTANCLALVTCMSDGHKKTFLKKLLNPEELINFRLKTLEELQTQNVEKALVLANPDKLVWHREKSVQYTQGQIVSGDLSDKVVAVCGVLLPKRAMPKDQDLISRLVLVESTCKNLQSLAMAISFQKAVLLEGPIGCGKTALVEYISAVTGRTNSPDILKVQLGDQTDSKMLLGMYRCTDVPGEFVWQPGTLTQAVTKGHWILLEDIDYAPLDVISVLIPLLENGELLIPGRGDCFKVSPGFQFFATRRLLSSGSGWYRQQNSHAPLLDKFWTKIQLVNMSRGELKEVLLKRYASLSVVTDRLLDIYIQLTGDKHQASDRSSPEEEIVKDPGDRMPSLEGRGLSLRDVLKWCNRIVHNFDGTSPDTALNVFHEALDCFTAMLSKKGSRLKMAESIGSKLNLSKKKAEFYCQLHKPAITVGELVICAGRIEILRKQTDTVIIPREKQTFAATRPASVLVEQLAVCIDKGEPVLLVGETGTGKTSTVQYLANVTGHRLRVVNMNQQSDTADLLGGYKPVDHRLIWLPLREGFEELFTKTFSRKQNVTFLGHIQTCYRQRRWHDLLKLMQHVLKSAINKVKGQDGDVLLKEKWEAFSIRLNQAQQQMKMAENALMFSFVEGTLAQAVRKGEWILLDEINLATAETLECLSGLLEGANGSLVLLDRGDTEPLMRHSSFRLFACMNPATDVGKRNLPPGIRNRFTELYVDELEDENDLRILVADYLKGLNVGKNLIQGIISFYLSVRKESSTKLVDGTGHRPHYSLRTLCRALRYAASNPCNSIQRSLYEGFCLGFLTQLDRASHPIVQKLICQHIVFCSIKNLLKQPLPEPKGGQFKQMEGYWVSVGDKEPALDESYILTPSVTLNLRDLVRVVSAGTYPVLIQGETSVGKTSLIRWLASATGNHCVRINNHEHTDIQEYIGFYTSNASGKLVFKEGVLIDAMRKGYWIILDELNLAPTDVLEALNRLLDDNRELFISETQEVVKAHPRFMLFATQNPPGAYGGRKVLSRAFRNRFVELHFDELPSSELETILHKRCSLPPSYCSKLVKVMLDLQSHRRGSTVFAGKYGFITLRDLFRWAERYRLTEQTEKDYDWLQHLADDGFMLLAGRVRKPEEEVVIQSVLEKHFKKKLNPQALFSDENLRKQLGTLFSSPSGVMESEFCHIVWTRGMRRLATLVGRALKFDEPILLVGDTGCGKTTICQIFAALAEQTLYSVNCHMHMETSDFLGGLRPIRQRSKEKSDSDETRLFEWHDGPLVLAMKKDGFFLMDEISLADDSVLERLNSVLEVEKSLVLAEKGSQDDEENEVEVLTAGKKFRIVATMNPGGDFGKKELSPALRNRFTEIWCPQSNDREDLIEIIKHNLRPGLSLDGVDHKGADIAAQMMDFIEWLINQEYGRRCIVSVRDILSWVNFMNVMMEDEEPDNAEEDMDVDEPDRSRLSPVTSFVHAACLVYIDGIGAGTTSSSASSAQQARKECLRFLSDKLSAITVLTDDVQNVLSIYDRTKERKIVSIEYCFGIHPFYIPIGPKSQGDNCTDYDLSAGTTSMNAQRLLRALKLNKPILLEGSPGVGKTSLVAALAKSSGNKLVRINLSEQTDVTDLFGTDLPVEGGKGGEFSWRDGPLLAALKHGHWIVLDELNLASQSVLEGLNACFDHRAEIYIPELGMSFQVEHEKTKIFGCQNPFRQGGGRKGFPKSFLNRFTQVYVDPLTVEDMECIGNALFPALGSNIISKMVAFNNKVDQEVMVERKWGQKGGPWEFNLRDLFRWCQLILVDQSPGFYDPGQHVFLVYGERLRSMEDRNKIVEVFKDIFGQESSVYIGTRHFHATIYKVQIGYSILSRGTYVPPPSCDLALLHRSLQPLESIMKCVQMSSMVILVGPSSVGKTSMVHLLAQLTGHRLKVMAMNSAMDTTELLGGFEQADLNRPWQSLLEKVEDFLGALMRDSLLATDVFPEDCEVLLRAWSSFCLHCKPKSVDERDRSGCADLLVKIEGFLGLIHRMNKKTNSFSKTEFSSLGSAFQTFKDQLHLSAGGRSHGTFEWVDGMLVQALQSGDWLLMDNVNFCSASVLDRLNALLEPGGVLTISERGVIDGSSVTITPHSSFRLFLSMDPAHGEISRAMRNRGVEIYIPGDDDGNELDQLDLKMLLHGLGLVGDPVCEKLLAVHTETKESVVGSTVSSLSSLINAATLISQQLQRGFGLEKAFIRACWEVYVCSQSSQSIQKIVEEIVLKQVSTLTSEESSSKCFLAMGLWPDALPSALLSAEDSALATVFQDGQMLTYCINMLNLTSSRSLPLNFQDLQKVMQSTNPESLRYSAIELCKHWTEDVDVIAASVKLVTEKAAFSDWMLRVRWLNDMIKKIPQGRESVCIQLKAGVDALNNLFSSSLSDGIRDVIKRLQPNMADVYGIPLDLRWNMQRLDIMRNSTNFDVEVAQRLKLLTSLANRSILFLNREKQIYLEKTLLSSNSIKKNKASALKLSSELHKDPGIFNSLPHAIVSHLAVFFELWDALLLHCVQSNPRILTDEAMAEVIYRLHWRDRFWSVSNSVSVDSLGLALLSLHWHWLEKLLMDKMPPMLLEHENHMIYQEIKTISLHIQSCLSNPVGFSISLKRLQKMLGRPLPYKEESVVQVVEQLKTLGKALRVFELRPVKGEHGWQQDIYRLQAAASGWSSKENLLRAWGLLLKANYLKDINTDELKSSVDLIYAKLKADGVVSCRTEDLHSDVADSRTEPHSLIQLSSKVQMWPVTEYLTLLWQYKLTVDIMVQARIERENKQQETSILSELRQHILYSLERTPASVHQLKSLWYLLDLKKVTSGEVTLLWSELVNSALEPFWSSTATSDPEYWSLWKAESLADENKTQKSLLDPSVKGPGIFSTAILSKCFHEVFTSSSKAVKWDVSVLPGLLSSQVTLGEWLERTQQLQDTSSVLWSNFTVSSMAEFRSTDAKLQGLLLCRLLTHLKFLLPKDLQEDYLQNCERLTCKDIAALRFVEELLEGEVGHERIPDDIISLSLTCMQQFYGEVHDMRDLPEPAQRGCLWVNMGLLQVQVWLPQTMFDPAVKKEYKLKYAKEELYQLECEWKTRDVSAELHTGRPLEGSVHTHPHIRILQQRIQQLREQIVNLSKKQAYRPQKPSYINLYQEIHNYVESIAQVSHVQDLSYRLIQVLLGNGPKSRPSVLNLLNEEATWQQSHHKFRRLLAEEYALYPDAVIPLQAAILQMQHGMRILAAEVYKYLNSILVSPAKLSCLIISLIAFPSLSPAFPSYLAHAEELCSMDTLDVLRGIKQLSLKYSTGNASEGSDCRSCPTTEQLLVNALLYLRSHVLSLGELDQKSIKLFRHICQAIINEWDEQESCERKREAQENSLYKRKSKSHLTEKSEDEEDEKEFRERFPLYDKDFEDITAQPSLEEEMDTKDDDSEVKSATAEATLLSQGSMRTVMLIHQQLCLCSARAFWYQQRPSPHQAKYYLSAFLSCYQSSSSVIAHFYPMMGADLNHHLLGSQLLASTLIQNTVFADSSSELVLHHESSYDFYQHPNLEQVRHCQPVLNEFTKEVKQLLQKWCEHPALTQLLVVMDRIRGFPLSSPVAKFLNGLEILLTKSQDWEENASRDLSLRKHLDAVTQLIIQWRKLELNCWSFGLDNAMERHAFKSTRHWFTIYQLIENYMQEQCEENAEGTEKLTLPSVVRTLQAFIEGSTLGEFNTRLQMLLVFHCHVLLMPQIVGKDSLCSVLWNLYHYYAQFSECIQTRITLLRQPLEKELKDFVKISKWNDVSFWSIKQSVEKTHRTLFKFMKKFEASLSEPCRPALAESTKEEQLDCLGKQEETDGKETKVQQLSSLLKLTVTTKSDIIQDVNSVESLAVIHAEDSLQHRLPKLIRRMKKLCSSFIKRNTLPDLVNNLDEFTGGVITSVHDMQAMTVDQTADKEKMKSEVKHILIHKQRALSDLFKMLTKTGLSYRKGLTWARSRDTQEMLYLRPLDLHSALTICDMNGADPCEAMLLDQISSAWDGCQKYFYRSLARDTRLQAALAAPVKELGLSNVDRCKGFAAHLLKMLIKQRTLLSALTEQWVTMRNLLSCMKEISSRLIAPKDYNVAFPPQTGIQQWAIRLQSLSMQCIVAIEQLSWFIQCCPHERGSCEENTKSCTVHGGPELNSHSSGQDFMNWEQSCPSPVAAQHLPAACTMRKQDSAWQRLTTQVSEMLTEMKTVKANVDNIRRHSCEPLFYSWKDFEVCTTGVNALMKVSTQLQDTEALFCAPGLKCSATSQQMVLISSLQYIREEVKKSSTDFTAWKTQLLALAPDKSKGKQKSDKYVDDFSQQVESAILAVLCAIQSLVERNNGNEQAKPTMSEEVNEEKAFVDILKSGHLTKLLSDDLTSDIRSMQVQRIISAVSELIERLKSYREDCLADKHKIFNQACSLLVRLIPMLSTYSDLILFYLTMSLATHRGTGKLLTVLAHLFTELAQKGFCLPKELMEEVAGEGATEFHDYEGGGIGEGEGVKDVSDKIENEEQVEDSHRKGEEKEKEKPEEQPDVKAEDNAIEMSEDFEGKMHDGDQEKPDEAEDEEKSENEDEELEKQMGDLGDAEADKLDERLWGDEDDEDENSEDKMEETGPGMDEGNSELVAKDDNIDADSKNKDKKQSGKDEEQTDQGNRENKEKVHEQIDEREYDENEKDPYHGKQEKPAEPEALDLPNDLNLENEDNENDKEDKGDGEENPYEIEEKPMDLDDNGKEDQKEEDASDDPSKEGVEPGIDEEGVSDDKKEEEAEVEKEQDAPADVKEHSPQNDEEEKQCPEENKSEALEEDAEKGIPAEQGLKPEEKDEAAEQDEDVPESSDRMEHESSGQTSEENLQSESAVELAGAASEKDKAKEEHGSGAADASQSEGHESKLMARLASQRQSASPTQSFKRKLGAADNERSLGDHSERVQKRLKMVESSGEAEKDVASVERKVEEADAYEHIKEGTKSYDAQTYDVASKEQQMTIKPFGDKQEEEVDADKTSMDQDDKKDEDLKAVTVELKPEEIKSSTSKNKAGSDGNEMEIPGTEIEMDKGDGKEHVPAEIQKLGRSKDSTVHTAYQFLTEVTITKMHQDSIELRVALEKQLEEWQTQRPGSPDEEKASAEMWQRYLFLTAPLSQQLCEQLRLILEPTQAAKLKGDYRTGKRLNMRKVIPYIASQFRKDKIWLRRTKPSKRQYQICLAIDDSSSMVDNHSKQLAFESLAVIGNALTLLEVGQIAVCSFGETVQLLHPFHEQFSDQSGARILRLCKFQQKKTRIAQFLESSANMFAAAQQFSQNFNPETAQLLLIVSDGRGLFLEGKERVTAAVQTARNANIFVIFVILDNPNSRDSIMDIKVPVFGEAGEMPEIRSYMDEFPFPFYIILRDVNALPETLSDALRQWFELVTAHDHQ
ncbi:midasin isoform X2 [Ambystoma mexicanum]|uniref:midasin isoform X2 n=1 Tax=Ambystoma mexicanum TaxID=8296 RepID=UPI0037E78A96